MPTHQLKRQAVAKKENRNGSHIVSLERVRSWSPVMLKSVVLVLFEVVFWFSVSLVWFGGGGGFLNLFSFYAHWYMYVCVRESGALKLE